MYLKIICDIPYWWVLLTYYVFKYHIDVTYSIEFFAEERINFGKEEGGKSYLNQAPNKL